MPRTSTGGDTLPMISFVVSAAVHYNCWVAARLEMSVLLSLKGAGLVYEYPGSCPEKSSRTIFFHPTAVLDQKLTPHRIGTRSRPMVHDGCLLDNLARLMKPTDVDR
ncbi:MAG: hypothetical protein ACR2MW_00435 [Chthoniobacterales bacterium]